MELWRKFDICTSLREISGGRGFVLCLCFLWLYPDVDLVSQVCADFCSAMAIRAVFEECV